jgi:aspartate aminotransferase
MADRIIEMRSLLRYSMEKLGSKLSWRHVTDQIGMFCFTGLRPAEVAELKEKYHIYITDDGRISIAGLNTANVQYVAASFHAVTSKR